MQITRTTAIATAHVAAPNAHPVTVPASHTTTLDTIRRELGSPFGFMSPMSCPWGASTPPTKPAA